MKNIFLIVILLFAISTLISMLIMNEPVSGLALDNIEALAQNEGGDVDCIYYGSGCYNGLWYPVKREVHNC